MLYRYMGFLSYRKDMDKKFNHLDICFNLQLHNGRYIDLKIIFMKLHAEIYMTNIKSFLNIAA